MSFTSNDLDSFTQFAHVRLQTEAAESLEELVYLWRLEHSTPKEEAEVHAAIRQGLADIQAGRGRPVEDVMTELANKYNLPVE